MIEDVIDNAIEIAGQSGRGKYEWIQAVDFLERLCDLGCGHLSYNPARISRKAEFEEV